jgi:hypothetical protein
MPSHIRVTPLNCRGRAVGALVGLAVIAITFAQHQAAAQEGAPSPPTREQTIRFYYMSEALRNVAAAYRTAIGLEEPSPEKLSPPITVRFGHASLTQTLDTIVRAKPHYMWQHEPDGSFLVVRRNMRASLADVKLNSFDVRDLNRPEVESYLDRNPELTDWLNKQGCTRLARALVITGSAPQDTAKISLNNSGKSLRENLNEVVRGLGTYAWVVTETEKPGQQCQAGITLPPVMPPRR